MKVPYLFPHRLKIWGWVVLIPSLILGLITLITNYEPDFLEVNVLALFRDSMIGKNGVAVITKNNILDEIFGVLVIISGLIVAFSKEKIEDEFISKIRLESLVWATYVNYAILIFAFMFIYDMSFFWVMIFNIFTILLFFIARFNLRVWKLKKMATHEE